MKLKLFFLSSILGMSVANAQIPVTDAASIAEQVAKWAVQAQQMKSQIEQAQQQYQSITGSRMLGNILYDQNIRSMLPSDWQASIKSLEQLGSAGLKGGAKEIFEKNFVYDRCGYLTDAIKRNECAGNSARSAQQQYLLEESFSNANKRLSQIESLMSEINNTQDTKAIQELQARISVEQAMVQNELVKVQLFEQLRANQERLNREKRLQSEASGFSSTKTFEPLNLRF